MLLLCGTVFLLTYVIFHLTPLLLNLIHVHPTLLKAKNSLKLIKTKTFSTFFPLHRRFLSAGLRHNNISTLTSPIYHPTYFPCYHLSLEFSDVSNDQNALKLCLTSACTGGAHQEHRGLDQEKVGEEKWTPGTRVVLGTGTRVPE